MHSIAAWTSSAAAPVLLLPASSGNNESDSLGGGTGSSAAALFGELSPFEMVEQILGLLARAFPANLGC